MKKLEFLCMSAEHNIHHLSKALGESTVHCEVLLTEAQETELRAKLGVEPQRFAALDDALSGALRDEIRARMKIEVTAARAEVERQEATARADALEQQFDVMLADFIALWFAVRPPGSYETPRNMDYRNNPAWNAMLERLRAQSNPIKPPPPELNESRVHSWKLELGTAKPR